MDKIEKKAREFLEEQTAYPLNMLASVPVDAALRAIAAALTARDAELRALAEELRAIGGSVAYDYAADRILALVRKGASVQEVVMSNMGDSEATFIADGERLNCPSCGGSGHVDDSVQAKVPETLPEFLEWVADELVKRDRFAGSFAEGSASELRGRAHLIRVAMPATVAIDASGGDR